MKKTLTLQLNALVLRPPKIRWKKCSQPQSSRKNIIRPPPVIYPEVEFYTDVDTKVHLYCYTRRQHGIMLQEMELGLELSS